MKYNHRKDLGEEVKNSMNRQFVKTVAGESVVYQLSRQMLILESGRTERSDVL